MWQRLLSVAIIAGQFALFWRAGISNSWRDSILFAVSIAGLAAGTVTFTSIFAFIVALAVEGAVVNSDAAPGVFAVADLIAGAGAIALAPMCSARRRFAPFICAMSAVLRVAPSRPITASYMSRIFSPSQAVASGTVRYKEIVRSDAAVCCGC
jgi:hypothetical protein